MSSLFVASTPQTASTPDLRDPPWLQASTKRVIPNHLVPKKKIGFQLSTVASKSDKPSESNDASKPSLDKLANSDFNLISFGNNIHRNSTASFADSLALVPVESSTEKSHGHSSLENPEDLPLYNYNDDLPPPKSLYDLNDEAFLSFTRPTQNTNSFMNKDPKSFHNAFDKLSAQLPPAAADNNPAGVSSLHHLESAILVFGYPESMANQVIAHFLEFGLILENLEAAKSTPKVSARTVFEGQGVGSFNADKNLANSTQPPIFSGKSWVKLTYDNPSSAMDALQECGSVFNGAIIGVVPYTKDTVEKLQKRKLSDLEDIGAGLPDLHQLLHPTVDSAVIGDSNDIQASYIKRLDIKDGSELFLKATKGNNQNPLQKNNNQKLGLWGTISNYLFGFHDL